MSECVKHNWGVKLKGSLEHYTSTTMLPEYQNGGGETYKDRRTRLTEPWMR
jgi:hypothetical protein